MIKPSIGLRLTHRLTKETIHLTGSEGRGDKEIFNINYIYSKTNKKPFDISKIDFAKMVRFGGWVADN